MPPEPANFSPTELAIVLSHYDLGVIESLTPFPRGSRRSPKIGIVAERGKFLLKRRAPHRAAQERVRVAHRVQTVLAEQGFPSPRIVPSRPHGRSFVQLRDQIYELFAYISGHGFDQTPEQARDAGATLARFHELTAPLAKEWEGVSGDFHDASGVRTGLLSIGQTLSSHDSFSGDEAELAGLIQFLSEAYNLAAHAVNDMGLRDRPHAVIHADFHPGNLLFRKEKVVALLDYDSVRLSQREVDIANGAFQCSVLAGGDPGSWPDHLDEDRLCAFLAGYAGHQPLERESLECLPHLMMETLIAECVPPISETGSVGRWGGYRVLRAVRRLLTWLIQERARLIDGIQASLLAQP